MADIGRSWTVLVFVLDSHPIDILPADEDPIPANGNPHPEVPMQVGEEENVDLPRHFEDVGDLEEIQQNNIDQGWEAPFPPPINNDGWGDWQAPQQEGELVVDNELEMVNNLAYVVVASAAGLMQHPDQPQESHSVSSDTSAFFRAEGALVTLDLPLPTGPSSVREVVLSHNSNLSFNSDFQIRDLATKLGLHQVFGPTPLVEMLLQEMANMAQEIQALLPMKTQLHPKAGISFKHSLHQSNGFYQWMIPPLGIMLKPQALLDTRGLD
jgi:hypothetical protein